ncbi:hypothetical protein HMPREF0083_04776 [Aneurinibacillus aneurinilyticus ATCC 12856]|uniref:Uncharacterized protein n=2 Tax=Aneurinibacillus aneurinilyticus TaxID=1391 RepID=U1WY05_ANEAE|nr:hypothetical protein HMPREF0083_04776 [Aneurinibacillus aneurinilyticus ATCC 12856]
MLCHNVKVKRTGRKRSEERMKELWWTRLFHRRCAIQERTEAVREWPNEREIMLILHTLKEQTDRAYDSCTIDREAYDASRHFLVLLDMVLPYAFITPFVLQKRIIMLIIEDAPDVLTPYLQLGEERQRGVRWEFLHALRCMMAELQRIVVSIQECEREAFTYQAAFIANGYKNSKTHL